ncbi:transposase, partial [candidate division KSB1 bacterium]|nr:transposase [candidate division KSB1 bacterium]
RKTQTQNVSEKCPQRLSCNGSKETQKQKSIAKSDPQAVKLCEAKYQDIHCLLIVDQIYGTRENRSYLNSKNIRFCGKQLERPPKLSKEEKRIMRIEARLRSQIEGKFGEGKRKYDLDLVKTKTMVTSESWIAAIFFVMDIARWLREDFFVLFLKPIFSGILNNSKELFMIKQYRSALVY